MKTGSLSQTKKSKEKERSRKEIEGTVGPGGVPLTKD